MSARDLAAQLHLRRQGQAWRGACPACGYAAAFSLTEREGRTLWWCAACQDGEAIARALGFERRGVPAAKAANPANPSNDARPRRLTVRAMWQRALPMRGSPVVRYLGGPALAGLESTALRYLPSEAPAVPAATTGARFPSGRVGGATAGRRGHPRADPG